MKRRSERLSASEIDAVTTEAMRWRRLFTAEDALDYAAAARACQALDWDDVSSLGASTHRVAANLRTRRQAMIPEHVRGLRELRLAANLTQAQFAALLGVCQSTASRIERGASIPRRNVLVRLERWKAQAQSSMPSSERIGARARRGAAR